MLTKLNEFTVDFPISLKPLLDVFVVAHSVSDSEVENRKNYHASSILSVNKD